MGTFVAGVLTTVAALGGVAGALVTVQVRGRCRTHDARGGAGRLLMSPTRRRRVAR